MPDLSFPIDVTALVGQADISNSQLGGGPVERGPTTYGVNVPGFEQVPPEGWDFNGDGQADHVEPWGEEWGVWLQGRRPEDGDGAGNPLPPDFTIQPHASPDFAHQGLLERLSLADLKETDLYVFRAATGDLIAERQGLDEFDLDPDINRLYISLLLPSGDITVGTQRRLSTPYESGLSYSPEFLKIRDIDQLRPGEAVQVVAINRKTGYIGTATTTLTPPTGGMIDVRINGLQLGPPNLKVRVERKAAIGEQDNYLVGFEGAGLSSDIHVAVITEWYDHDGTPLPASLPGFTGRLARTVADRQLGGGVAHFPIQPGRHTQMLRLQGVDLLANHYYLHVNAQPYHEGTPDFGGTGAGDGLLSFRPRYYVPVKVAIFDE
ncbi:hypothetical protein CAI21_19420, partial [Alkalilimnicola ehrlichii]|uniref:hypothetical protein n=1 Tax=Alkalilimnicola ehrlichii TaxID=351052 RepID=UPI000E36DC93